MKKAQLSGSLRTNVGKKDAAALRNADRVPCVLYGTGEQIHFSVRSVDMHKLIFSADVYQVELDIEGSRKATAIIKDKQMHPVRDTAQHVDFLELSADKSVTVRLPLRTTGASIGVMNGGKLTQAYRTLRMAGLPADLPESVTVDVTKMRIGHAVRIADLNVPGVTFLEPANAVILSVKMARGAVADIADDEDEEEGTSDAPAAEETESTEAAAE
ncbi:MAG: 50S ribosomal protein L25/general stress protein Ctc [Bacteroidetes bacterium RIFCSPHIGHO2_02_FULL_44_7]|nr:MAG: 50S ribosomal protein L25/general stress protein Ctc [Bacteroidetes bacterium RIFCSPHIGHO2_02_FULL_44_7]